MMSVSKSLIAATAAFGLISAAPTPAAANPIILAPAAVAAIVVGSVVGGVVLGAAVTQSGPFAPAPVVAPAVSVTDEATVAGCHWGRAYVDGAWRRAQVCD